MPRMPRYLVSLSHPYPGNRRACLYGAAALLFSSYVGIVVAGDAAAQSGQHALPAQTLRSARTASPHIGSAMAVLATLQDADVLPPEGTREANHIIRFTIQFQSAFTKSDDPAIQSFARQALAQTYGDQAPEILRSLRSTGWTADILEQLSDEEARRSAEDLQSLAQGFAPFNLSVEEFHRFMQLVRDARQAFQQRGLEFRNVFLSRRKEMPGA